MRHKIAGQKLSRNRVTAQGFVSQPDPRTLYSRTDNDYPGQGAGDARRCREADYEGKARSGRKD